LFNLSYKEEAADGLDFTPPPPGVTPAEINNIAVPGGHLFLTQGTTEKEIKSHFKKLSRM